MNYWPLIERELHVGLRRRYGIYQFRIGSAVAVMAAAFWVLFVWSAWFPTAGFGSAFFRLLAASGYFGALLAGVLLSADSLSRERREGTLDLLLLTPLRTGDVVIGKLLAGMTLPLCALVATVPVLQVSVMLGGITGGQSARLLLVWSNALFFALACSSLISSLCREQRVAQTSAFLFVLFVAEAIPFLGSSLAVWTTRPIWRFLALLLSPGGPYQLVHSYPVAMGWFWGALVMNQVIAWLTLGLAQVILARSRLKETARFSSSPAPQPDGAVSDPPRRDRKLDLLEERPISWLACRNSDPPWLLWSSALLGLIAVLAHWPTRFGVGRNLEPVAFLLLLHVLFKFRVAANATHALATDRRTGALESILATPVDARDIAAGLFHNFERRFAGPVLMLSGATAFGAAQAFETGFWEGALALVLAAVALPLDCYCLLWTGLFQGLAARTPALALGMAVFQIVVLPWGWFMIGSGMFPRSSFIEFAILMALIIPLNHGWFVANARAHFYRHFRTLALKPFAEKNPVIESDWSPINWEEE